MSFPTYAQICPRAVDPFYLGVTISIRYSKESQEEIRLQRQENVQLGLPGTDRNMPTSAALKILNPDLLPGNVQAMLMERPKEAYWSREFGHALSWYQGGHPQNVWNELGEYAESVLLRPDGHLSLLSDLYARIISGNLTKKKIMAMLEETARNERKILKIPGMDPIRAEYVGRMESAMNHLRLLPAEGQSTRHLVFFQYAKVKLFEEKMYLHSSLSWAYMKYAKKPFFEWVKALVETMSAKDLFARSKPSACRGSPFLCRPPEF